jgi:hypothetical protein
MKIKEENTKTTQKPYIIGLKGRRPYQGQNIGQVRAKKGQSRKKWMVRFHKLDVPVFLGQI